MKIQDKKSIRETLTCIAFWIHLRRFLGLTGNFKPFIARKSSSFSRRDKLRLNFGQTKVSRFRGLLPCILSLPMFLVQVIWLIGCCDLVMLSVVVGSGKECRMLLEGSVISLSRVDWVWWHCSCGEQGIWSHGSWGEQRIIPAASCLSTQMVDLFSITFSFFSFESEKHNSQILREREYLTIQILNL